MSCGVGRRRGSDPVLLWLWHRPAAAALIQPLAWKPPYAVRAGQEMEKRPPPPKKKIGGLSIRWGSVYQIGRYKFQTVLKFFYLYYTIWI